MPTVTSAQERRLRDALLRAADLVATTTSARLALQRLASLLDPDVLPEAARAVVVARLDEAGDPEPLSFKDVERRLKAAWGGPVGRTLDDLEREPAAVTAGSQVHRGVADGADVAVKVRRPGLAEALRGDLSLLDALTPLFAPLVPAADLGAVSRELRERLLDELDLEHEAGIQRTFHRALRRHPDLVVPAPRTDLAREDVLVAEWIAGTPLREVAHEADEARRRRAGELSVRFFLGTAALGHVHADPHPDDVLLLGDGRLAVLDFGAAGTVPKGRAALAADLLEALAADDGAAAGRAIGALGWLPEADGPALTALARDVAGPLLSGSVRLDAAALRAATARGTRRLADGLALALRATPAPADLWPLRGAGSLALLLARLDVEADWVGQALDALRDGP